MSIKPLPHDVVNKIKSSAAITSLNGVAVNLLHNSLDADATRINVTVDYVRGNCTIEDNGRGIPPNEFGEHGGIGKLHCTSKFPPSNKLHGRNGAFLASLAALSLMCVSSRHHRQVSHNSVLLHNSIALSRHLPAPPEQRLVAFDHGTRVTVRDLFGSMPVRVKYRATTFSDRINIDREWSSLIYGVVATLLSWPSEVSVLLRDAVGQRELRLRYPTGLNHTAKAARLVNQASLASPDDVESLVPISATAGHVTIQGCVSLRPVATRRSQFISIGIHALSNTDGSVVFEEVNKIFKQSSFGPDESFQSGKGAESSDPYTTDLKGRRSIERSPLFYFNIELDECSSAHDVDDILDHHTDDLVAILDLLRAVSYGFLQKYGFRPRKTRVHRENAPPSSPDSTGRSSRSIEHRPLSRTSYNAPSSPATLRTVENSNVFDAWHRIKVGHATKLPTRKAILHEDQKAEARLPHDERLVGEGGRLLRKPFDGPIDDVGGSGTQESVHFGQNGPPLIDEVSLTNQSEASDCEAQRRGGRHRVIRKGDRDQPSEWLQQVVREWENPVFKNVPAQIPRLYNEPPENESNDHSRSNYFNDPDGDCGVLFDSASVHLNGRISKSALSEAEVISQVDLKFILLKLPLDNINSSSQSMKTSALVMLDQHAADERCRLEELMANYFIKDGDNTLRVSKLQLDEPLLFEVPELEGNLLQRYKELFSTWGIVYGVQTAGLNDKRERSATQSQVIVTFLPSSIFERCRGEPRVLIDLLRRESWNLAEGGRAVRAPKVQSTSEHSWAANFQGCPRGILELLHSRACRSAIMFNDELTMPECEELLRRLSSCAFPFQCAHGRPSMAPLVDLGHGARIGGWQRDDATATNESWRRWMRN